MLHIIYFYLLTLLFIESASFVLQTNQQIENLKQQCGVEMVFIAENNDQVCLPKVPLKSECEFDEQCSSKTSNSFCALLDDYLQNDYLHQDIRPVCLCRDGFTPSMGHLHCVPVQYCTFDGFNSAMEQMDCRQENQFCRDGLCHCMPNYDLNYAGRCVPIENNFTLMDVLKSAQKNHDRIAVMNKLKVWFESLLLPFEIQQESSHANKFYVLFMLIVYLLGMALFLLGQTVWTLYNNNNI